MVKGISRQVIVLQSPQTEMFEQAIFILKDSSQSVTDEQLIKEATRLVNHAIVSTRFPWGGIFWACCGSAVSGLLWLLTVIM